MMFVGHNTSTLNTAVAQHDEMLLQTVETRREEGVSLLLRVRTSRGTKKLEVPSDCIVEGLR